MGMLVFVYRNTLGDTTNNGTSCKFNELVVENGEGPFDADSGNGMVLELSPQGLPRLVPSALVGKNAMAGGNYAGTSDSRWTRQLTKLCGYNPGVVPIYDRVEN